jgi:hypothetical protein
VNLDGDVVAHRAGRNEERGFLPHDLRGFGFQTLNRRVIAQHVIPDLRLGHGAAHGG